MECNALNRRKLWHAAFSGSAHFFVVVKLFSLPSHASCGRKERRGRRGLRPCPLPGRKGCVGFAFGRRGMARGPQGGESGKACCGQRSCTCRGVLEYLPQSTRVLCGKHCEALRTAPCAFSSASVPCARMLPQAFSPVEGRGRGTPSPPAWSSEPHGPSFLRLLAHSFA